MTERDTYGSHTIIAAAQGNTSDACPSETGCPRVDIRGLLCVLQFKKKTTDATIFKLAPVCRLTSRSHKIAKGRCGHNSMDKYKRSKSNNSKPSRQLKKCHINFKLYCDYRCQVSRDLCRASIHIPYPLPSTCIISDRTEAIFYRVCPNQF